MSKLLALAMLCLMALLPLEAQAHVMPYGTHVIRWHHLTTALDGSVVDRAGWVYSFPVKVQPKPAVQMHKRAAIHHPKRVVHRRPPARVNRPRGRWVRVFTTGYDDTGYTASGLLAGYGRVAVDPSVFRLGTRFYIPGYGYAVAADTGGAVIGYRIDLWFATASQCYANTGYRMVEVLS